MFKQSLIKNNNKEKIFLENKWIKKIYGLVRTPFFDNTDPDNGYVVYYSEARQEYGIVKYSLLTGETLWETTVVNGGYGTPTIFNNLVIILKEFNGIAALDKKTGDLIWEYAGNARVRSSVSIINNNVVFSSGGTLYFLKENGEKHLSIHKNGAFFFGNVEKVEDHFMTLGTQYNSSSDTSNLYLFAFSKNGNLLYEVDLGESYVISSDTSGFWLENSTIYIGSSTSIYKINAKTGKILWEQETEGIASRHIPITDDANVYYTTLKGVFGCLTKEDGKKVWNFNTEEGSILSPPTLIDGTLCIIADCGIYLVDKNSGMIYSQKTIGHAPYSACVVNNGKLYVGGGEPPLHGLLIAYDIENKNTKNVNNYDYFVSGNYVENSNMQITLNTYESNIKVSIDASVISDEGILSPISTDNGINVLSIPLQKNLISGYYALPIHISRDKYNTTVDVIKIYLSKKKKLPKKYQLTQYNNSNVKQNDEFYSGAALAQFVMKNYDKDISQEEFRKIIDHVKQKSGWKDGDFQTWRLILKRVLSSPAKTLNEFKKLEEAFVEVEE